MLEFMPVKRRFNILKLKWETVFYAPKHLTNFNNNRQEERITINGSVNKDMCGGTDNAEFLELVNLVYDRIEELKKS